MASLNGSTKSHGSGVGTFSSDIYSQENHGFGP
jgi:hypothetical protein